MAQRTYTDDDVGKRVVNATGNKIGIVTEVRNGDPYVDPDVGMFDTVKAKLGWEDIDDDAYPLQDDQVSEVTDDEIRLGGLWGRTYHKHVLSSDIVAALLPLQLFGGDFRYLAAVFFVLALVAAAVGMSGVAGISMNAAKWMVIIFIVPAIVVLAL